MHRYLVGLALLSTFACARTPEPSCTPLGTMPGPEDFDRVGSPEHPTFLISAAARREAQSDADNGIWALEWPRGAAIRLALVGRDRCSFHPHGITTAEVEPGRFELWVINHHDDGDLELPPEQCQRTNRHVIEHYRVELQAGELHFIERLTSPLLTNPNDLDATPDGRLWISNNPGWEKPSELIGDMLWGRKRGRVVHYDPSRPEPERWRVAMDRLLYANGILIEAQEQGGLVLWVASARGQLDRHLLGDDGTVLPNQPRLRPAPKLGGTLDNLMEADGAVWVAAHPKSLAFIRHREDPAEHAPTRIYRVDRSEDPHTAEVLEVTQGQANAGSTVLPVDGGSVVIGQVFDEGLRVCPRG